MVPLVRRTVQKELGNATRRLDSASHLRRYRNLRLDNALVWHRTHGELTMSLTSFSGCAIVDSVSL